MASESPDRATDRIWLRHYPQGVPADIDATAYDSVASLFEEAASEFADLPAYTNLGAALTFAEAYGLAGHFAAFLQQELDIRKGDRVALMMPNLLQYPVALFGVLRAGAVVVNVNPMYTARELTHQLKDSDARAIVIVENFAHTLQTCLNDVPVEHVITTEVGDLVPAPKRWLVNFIVKRVRKMVPAWQIQGAIGFREALRRGTARRLEAVALDHGDLAFLQYTGGTTGVSKGAMLTHGNVIANVQQASAWLDPYVEKGKEIIITALPLYHIFALTANLLVFLKLGGLNVLITNPRDIPQFVKDIRPFRFTAITAVNTLFNALLNNEDFRRLDFSSLKVSLGGGMAVQRAVAQRWKELTGSTLIEAYGLTETSPAVCINPLDLEEYNAKIGLPLPSTEVSIRDEEGRSLALGEVGEICVRGPQVMKGYWNRPEETAKVLSEDGWLRTGDMGIMDEQGHVQIVDRKKDMINVSGFNVFPNEIEDVLAMHPGILEAGVVGVPDEKSGEAIRAVVVKKDPGLTEAQVIEHCRKYLTGYKVPKQVEFRDELPKTNVGKILRRHLKTQ